MVPKNVAFMVNGEFIGFQAYYEGPRELCSPLLIANLYLLLSHRLGTPQWSSFDAGGVSVRTLYTPSLAPTHFVSDMGGLCPFGTGTPDCYFETKWTPNDPVSLLHHAARIREDG